MASWWAPSRLRSNGTCDSRLDGESAPDAGGVIATPAVPPSRSCKLARRHSFTRDTATCERDRRANLLGRDLRICLDDLSFRQSGRKIVQQQLHGDSGAIDARFSRTRIGGGDVIVDSLEDAVTHINQYGSHHTDVIVTQDDAMAERFLREVDSACVFHNVSSRFADGGEFGFGAEIGISTDKLHARGPMGLRELTSYQYRVRGKGQVKG